MTLAEQIQNHVIEYCKTYDREAILYENKHAILCTEFLPNEIDITALSNLLAEALTKPLSTKKD